jgi:hypothetical protein
LLTLKRENSEVGEKTSVEPILRTAAALFWKKRREFADGV